MRIVGLEEREARHEHGTLFICRSLILVAALTVAATGCTRRADAEGTENTATSPPQEITISTKNYFFVAPDTIEAGITNIRLINQTDELHHVQMVKLADDHTAAELQAALESFAHERDDRGNPDDGLPAWVTFVGGPNVGPPDGESRTTVDLEPGDYALLCLIPSPKDGMAHLAKGMVRALTVVASDRPRAAEPAADAVITLDDYEFGITGEIRVGRRTLRVENAASQPHEIVLVQLAPGMSADDFLQWAGTLEGPPPGTILGGTTAIHRSVVNYLTVDLTAGEHALFCFVRDEKDGRSHIAHGMVQQITIAD